MLFSNDLQKPMRLVSNPDRISLMFAQLIYRFNYPQLLLQDNQVVQSGLIKAEKFKVMRSMVAAALWYVLN